MYHKFISIPIKMWLPWFILITVFPNYVSFNSCVQQQKRSIIFQSDPSVSYRVNVGQVKISNLSNEYPKRHKNLIVYRWLVLEKFYFSLYKRICKLLDVTLHFLSGQVKEAYLSYSFHYFYNFSFNNTFHVNFIPIYSNFN